MNGNCWWTVFHLSHCEPERETRNLSVQTKNCEFSIGDTHLVSGVSLSVTNGEVVSLIGANGAGKSSLLKLISGEYTATRGNVFLDGEIIADIDLDRRARKLAVLPQRSMLDFPFLVHEVIEMGRYPQMTGIQTDRKVTSEVVARLGLDDLSNRVFTTLSGGERQRVQIARVLAQLWEQPETANYLFDEPTAPLDLAHQLEFFKHMRSLAEKGSAILLVVHDINLAARFSDRLILLKDGKLIADGVPEGVITIENMKLVFNVDVNILTSNPNQAVQITY
ncbi:MAG: heme ABC transporter ATP-binding protein [Gammaproteobacteria bacterium]|nr:heme ABC transporter ATP-binding protein [Gammaproteobacteria bacterium]